MLLATTDDGQRVLATRDEVAFCPECAKRVVPKMGKVVVHHWAHRPGADCNYGFGMTEWHYRWILRHYNRDGWLIEYKHNNYRFDCYHPERALVLEFQSRPVLDYMVDKSQYCFDNGIRLNWVLNASLLGEFTLCDRGDGVRLEFSQRWRLIIKIFLRCVARFDTVSFYIDFGRSGEYCCFWHGSISVQPHYVRVGRMLLVDNAKEVNRVRAEKNVFLVGLYKICSVLHDRDLVLAPM